MVLDAPFSAILDFSDRLLDSAVKNSARNLAGGMGEVYLRQDTHLSISKTLRRKTGRFIVMEPIDGAKWELVARVTWAWPSVREERLDPARIRGRNSRHPKHFKN